MMEAKRILLVAAANSTTGGGERHVADLLTGLVERGYLVAVAAPSGGDLERLAQNLGVKHFGIPLSGALRLDTVLKLRDAISEFEPNIIHAHGTRAASFARLAKNRLGVKVVYTVHGIHADKGLARLVKLPLERKLKSRTDCFIAVCESDRRKGADLGILEPEKTHVIYNGIAPLDSFETPVREAEMNLPADSLVILHVGRASEQKGQPDLLEAFAGYLKTTSVQSSYLAMLVAPDDGGVLYRSLHEKVRELGIEDNVRWLELRENVLPLYLVADALVLSSRWEGFPYVILEAANAGCPIVSTNVDGISEAASSPAEGLLVPASDPEALMDALLQFADMSKEEREAMAARAKTRVNRDFTLDNMIEKTVVVYEKLALESK